MWLFEPMVDRFAALSNKIVVISHDDNDKSQYDDAEAGDIFI